MEKSRPGFVGRLSGGIAFDAAIFAASMLFIHLASPYRWIQLLILFWSIPPLLVGYGAGAALGELAGNGAGKLRADKNQLDTSDMNHARI